jgi:hypothetical protein
MNMGFWEKVPQLWRYVVIAALSLGISMVGVFWAVHRNCPAQGGRGGAIATVVAFAILFLRPDYGLRIYEERKSRISPNLPQIEQLNLELKALIAGLRINSSGQAHQNRALVIASIIGTIFWGFGDVFATWLT